MCHEQFELESYFGKKVNSGFGGGEISSDGISLVLRELDLRYSVTTLLARSLKDSQAFNRVYHGLETLLKQRVYSIALGTMMLIITIGSVMIRP